MAKIKRPQESSLMEVLEPRLLLSATPDQIVQALDLPGSAAAVSLNYTGDPVAVQSRTLHMTGGLLGFPTGLDEDFLMLSTGQAAWIDTVDNTGSSQGTDLGAEGVDGDAASISFTLSVPASDRQQKLKLDFMFLTEELAEWRSSTFLDSFTVSVNGANVVDMAIDDDLIVSDGTLPATGTFFDGRTPKLTAVYVIPPLTYSLDVVVTIADVGDGKYDSAALLDNVRFETSDYVYLNFEGMDVGDHFGWGSQTVLPAFDTEDIRVYEDRATVIDDILASVESKFDDYDIEFGLTPPAEGDYTTIVIGGSGDTWTHLDPILQVLKDLPSNVTLNDFGANTLLGLADAIDANNVEKNSLAVVLAKEFELYGPSAMDDLAMVIAHELGHTLGLRHVTDAGDLMYPS